MIADSNDTVKLVHKYKFNAYTTEEVNLREKASTSSATVSSLGSKLPLSLVSTEKYEGAGCSEGWYKVKTGSATGYVCSSYVNTEITCPTGWYKIKLYKSLKGIYNYYNIGAYGSNPVIRGLAAAAGYVDDLDNTPWNTRKKAIINGASFIAEGYISLGQDTLFYQKFNVGPNNYFDKYTHQYITNILAPASESLSTYRSYENLGILDNSYIFKIPVYNSMPTWFTTHPPVK